MLSEGGDGGFRGVLRREHLLQHGLLPRLIAGDVVACELHAAEHGVEPGERLALLPGELNVVVPQEEDVRVVPEGAAVQLPAEDRVAKRIFRAHALAVDQAHVRLVVEIQPHVAADAAVFHLSERRRERHAAAEDLRLRHAFADEVHRVKHDHAARALRRRAQAHAVEKVELQEFKAPLAHGGLQAGLDIIPRLRVVEIQCVEAAPVRAAEEGLAVLAAQQPAGVLFCELRASLRAERRHPEPGDHAVRLHAVGDRLQPVREGLLLDAQPVAHGGLIAVVDLEHVEVHRALLHGGEILQNLLLGDVLIEIIPACVARDRLRLRRLDSHEGEPPVEDLLFLPLEDREVQRLVWLLDHKPLAVAPQLHIALRREDAHLGEARALIERGVHREVFAPADVAVGPAVEFAERAAVFGEVIVAVGAHGEGLLHELRHAAVQIALALADRVLVAVGPGLIAVEHHDVAGPKVKIRRRLDAHERHWRLRREDQTVHAALRRRLRQKLWRLLTVGKADQLVAAAGAVSNLIGHEGILLDRCYRDRVDYLITRYQKNRTKSTYCIEREGS